jgi:hypothetical protein
LTHLPGVVLAVNDESVEKALAPHCLDHAVGQLPQLLTQLLPHLFRPLSQLLIDQNLKKEQLYSIRELANT